MSTAALNRSFKQERRGSFFKLIESFACEIGTLKKEMGHKSEPKVADASSEAPDSLDEDVGGLFLRGSPCSGLCSGVGSRLSPGVSSPSGLRDSGYSGSLHRKLTVLDRLARTHAVWLQLSLSQQGALKILKNQPPGSFVVRRSVSLQRKVISVRMDSDGSAPVKDFAVKESQYSFSLEGSGLSFADLFRLVAFCCISRDVLPFTLKLPEPIAAAQTSSDLDRIAKQGAGFWDVQPGNKRKSSSLFSAPDRPPPPTNRKSPTTSTISTISPPQIQPRIKTRTPSELECCQSNGALCFINPLFIKVHQEDGNSSGTSETSRNDDSKERSPALESESRERSDAKLENSHVSPSKVEKIDQQSAIQRSPPPPRPPPPRFANRRAGQLTRAKSMPEKVLWVAIPKDKSEEGDRKSKDGSLLSRLGSSLNISPSTSPPKKILNISSPITIPKPSLPISLASLSHSPKRLSKLSPSSCSQEDAQCHLAMEEHVIEQALRRARLQRSVTCKEEEEFQDGGKESETPAEEKVNGGGQRLSDMSLSSDSSDSLGLSQSSGFFFPPFHDPNPPTLDEINAHLPLSLPPFGGSMEEDDDEDYEEFEEDYGVSLESDQEQDQDLTLVPPGHRTKRRSSAGAVVIQKALKGQLLKMSGVFNSLRTPEQRAIRKVVELSRDKTTYFGGLVQDFLAYMTDLGQEQDHSQGVGLGFDSGSELLQTVRQFLTQMKSYLRQSSELEPPIESLIPEDQIDRVLEKAMHKCVLKPLRPVISDALHESMVRSGAWSELRENMSLAKTKPPAEMGVSDAAPPDAVSTEKIRHKFLAMCKLYSPEKKVGRLLQVCKLIYTVMEDNSGRLFGADDFLPMLTYVLAQCDMPQLDNEILYMMELLDPTLLNGEGGYYLTSAYGAMSLIKNFQEEQAARVLSSQTRDTLHQWHRRRTTQRTAPSIDDFQNYLRVALQELDSGCTAKTLSVRPQATVEEVCSLCAFKFSVDDPQQYGLFLVTEGSSQQLAADTHPQKIKAELHSRDQPAAFHFVYRRVDFNPTAPADDANEADDANANLSPRLSLSLPPGNIHSVAV